MTKIFPTDRTFRCIAGGLRTTSRAAIVVGLIAGASSPAFAACDSSAPADGDTVVCDAVSPNPESDPIIAPGAVKVTVDMQDGAILQTSSSPAIDLGGGATIDMDGATVSDIDPGTIPASVADVIAGDFSSVATRQDFTDLFTGIGALASLQPTAGATVELGGDPVATEVGIQEITAIITVNKAQMADQAMNAITQYIASRVGPHAGHSPEPIGSNVITVAGGEIVSGGEAAIRTADEGSTTVSVTGGGTIASLAEGAPAIVMGERSSLFVTLGEYDEATPSGGTILTVGDGAAGIDAAQDDSALMVNVMGDGHIFTAGDNAPAVMGPGTNSVMAFEARGGLSTDGLPTIATFGDNSPGVRMHGEGNSTVTLEMQDIYATEFGPGMQTNGDNSILFDIDTGVNSSVSFSAVASSLGTYGDHSGVIRIAQDGNSDALVFLQSTSLSSFGAGSTLIDLSTTGIDSSITNLVMIGGTLASEGDGSAGILLGGAFSSSAQTFFMGSSTIDTLGDDAPAIDLGRHGSSSVATTVFDEASITTAGNRSGGIVGEMTGNDSAAEVTFTDLSISTLGADAPAIALVGAMNGSSVYAVSMRDGDFSTEGANSHGIRIGGGGQEDSLFSMDIDQTLVSTLGNGADGLRVDTLLADDNGVSVFSIGRLDIATAGDGARGIVLGGSATGDSIDSSTSMSLTNSAVKTLGDDATAVEIAGLSGSFSNSDWTLLVAGMDIATSGARSTGLSIGGIDGSVAGSIVNRVVNDVIITTQGEGAVGLLIDGPGELIDGSSFETVLAAIDIATSGPNAHGLVIGHGNAISLLGQNQLGESTADGTLVNGTIDTWDNIVATGTNSRAVLNRGILYGTFTVGDEVIGNLANNGLIESAEGAAGVAVRYTGTTDDIFELQTRGEVIGTVEAGAGSDLFVLGGEGSASFDFGLIGTQYNDFESFEKIGASTWAMTGSSDIEADFAVHDGVLRANGSFGGLDFTVYDGAVLGGTGTLGNVALVGGTLAPGNSIGTITVGDLTMDAASVLEIEVNAGGSNDLVVVNGTVELGGATLSVIEGSSFGGADPFNYLIIDNDGADPVGGIFGAIENDLAFLTPSVEYDGGDGNDVELTLTPYNTPPTPGPPPPPTPLFPTAAQTWNQLQAASALDKFDRMPGSDAGEVYLDILFMSSASARDAFVAASGELYASVLTDTALAGMAQAERMLARAHSGIGEGWALWLGGTARGGHLDGDGNAARLDGDSVGAELGIDYRGTGNGWAAGAAVGYLDGDVAVPGRNSRANYDGWTLGAYVRYGTGNAGLSASAAVDYASLNLTAWRRVEVGAVNRMAASAADLNSLSLAAELRYGLPLGGGLAAGPLASVRHADADLGSFMESGAGSLNLSSGGASQGITRLGGGAFVNWHGARGNLDLTAQYVDGEDMLAQVGLRMAGAPDHSFSVRAPLAQGPALLLGLSGALDLGGGWGLGGNLQWLARENMQNLSASLTITLDF